MWGCSSITVFTFKTGGGALRQVLAFPDPCSRLRTSADVLWSLTFPAASLQGAQNGPREQVRHFPAKSSLLTPDHVEQEFQNFKTFFWQQKPPLPFFFFFFRWNWLYKKYMKYIKAKTFQRSRAFIPSGCLWDSQEDTQGAEEHSLKTDLERDVGRLGTTQVSAGLLQ